MKSLFVINKLTCFKLSPSLLHCPVHVLSTYCRMSQTQPPTPAFVASSSVCCICVQRSTQPDNNSLQLESAFLGDNAVNAGDDGVKRSHKGKSCEDDEEGHLAYHIGLVMKERCNRHQPFVFSVFSVLAIALMF